LGQLAKEVGFLLLLLSERHRLDSSDLGRQLWSEFLAAVAGNVGAFIEELLVSQEVAKERHGIGVEVLDLDVLGDQACQRVDN